MGKQTVAVLASKGAKVYLAARSAEKYQKAIDEIRLPMATQPMNRSNFCSWIYPL
jgi:NADP-dependent 3-hydroxy acid dehydrogenase YdfG